MRMDRVSDIPYDELERRYTPLIMRFSRWSIYGMDSDDIAQELRMILARAQRNYDPERGESGFLHYLYRAFQNRMGQLAQKHKCKKRVPPALTCSLDDVSPQARESGFERVELMTGLSPEATRLAQMIIDGESKKSQWQRRLTDSELAAAVRELRGHLHDRV